MSLHSLRFLPEDPLHRPAARAVGSALAETRRPFSSNSREITVEGADLPWFIECGANFEAVGCPFRSHDPGDGWEPA